MTVIYNKVIIFHSPVTWASWRNERTCFTHWV